MLVVVVTLGNPENVGDAAKPSSGWKTLNTAFCGSISENGGLPNDAELSLEDSLAGPSEKVELLVAGMSGKWQSIVVGIASWIFDVSSGKYRCCPPRSFDMS